MSDYICIEIQAQIMKRLPVKSLIRFRSVSKPWKALIESSEFIKDYYLHNSQQNHHHHHLLIRYTDRINPKETKYVSIVDDDNDTFPLHKHSITAPDSIRLMKAPKIVISQGLFCVYNIYISDAITGKRWAFIWNPLINKKVDIEVPAVIDERHESVVGFWVCRKTGDIKLVLITYTDYDVDLDDIVYKPWEVKVFTLSSGVWRSPLCGNRPRNTIHLSTNVVDIGRFLYWFAFDMDDELETFHLIMTFDKVSEEFTEVCFPDGLARGFHDNIVISKLRESLVVFDYTTEVEKDVCKVWMMEHGDPKSFTTLFTVNMTDTSINRVLGYRMTGINSVLGYRMTGELVIAMEKNDSSDLHDELFVYEPYSKNLTSVDICAKDFSFYASSYTETLLLLDQ